MRLALSALTLLCLALAPAEGKPMQAPTLEGAARSPLIVLARYEGCDPKGATYFGGVKASYSLVEVWKGKKLEGAKAGTRLDVNYAFSDGSACLEPKGWTFSPKLMPKPGATFLLFLTPAGEGYRTFRGGYGRWPAAALRKAELATLRALLTKPLSPCTRCQGRHPRWLRPRAKGMTWETRCSPNARPWRELTFAFEKKEK